MTRIEVVQEIQKLLAERCEDPAEELIKMGNVFIEIGKALKGHSAADCRAILASVQALQ